MFKTIGIVTSLIASGAVGYNYLRYVDAPEAPVIHEAKIDLSNPKAPKNTLSFSSKIMDKNIFSATGYNDLSTVTLNYNGKSGNQLLYDESPYEGVYSYKITDTITNKDGNNYEYPKIDSVSSRHYFQTRFYAPQGTHISYNIKLKGSGSKGYFWVTSEGGWEKGRFDPSFPLVTVTKDASSGQKEIYVDDISPWKMDESNKATAYRGGFTTDINPDSYTFLTHVDKVYPNEDGSPGGKIVIGHNLNRDMKIGETIKYKKYSGNWEFSSQIPMNQITSEWTTFSRNVVIPDNPYYNDEVRGNKLVGFASTNGVLEADDFVAGYANEIRIKRNNKEIYNGYDTSFIDTEAKDVNKPNKVESIQSNIILKDSLTNQIKVNFTAPEDNGTEYTYTATASFDGNESPVSKPIKSIVKTGIEGYSYIVDINSSTEPDNTIDTRETSITKDVIKDDSFYYLHIKAIDKAGNASETIHKKIELQKTTSSIIPDKDGIRVGWSFSDADLNNYYFKVFKKENNNEFVEVVSKTVESEYLDVEGFDKENPLSPVLKSMKYNEANNSFEFIFDEALDRGTKYSYYAESYLNDDSKVSTSNIVSTEVLSGIKGCSYIANNSETFNPDDNIDAFDGNKIVVPASRFGKYIHIKSMDNQNNASDTLSIKAYDDVLPILDLRLNNYRPNNTGLTITATGNDNTKVKSIKLPDGNIVEGRTADFVVNGNGEYSFTVYDVVGNSFTKSINVTNIDKIAPVIEFEEFKEGNNYKIKVVATDKESGVSHIILPDGSRIDSDTYTLTVQPNVDYDFKVYDLAGNFITRVIQVRTLEFENVSANLDIYIKSENMLSLSLNRNVISFEDFNGTEDIEQIGALGMTINSSLPYEINAYLENEIQNSDKSETMDKRILNLKEGDDTNYKEFTDIKTKLTLSPDNESGNNKIHNFDFKLKGGIAHKKDVYKTTIKFEVNQK